MRKKKTEECLRCMELYNSFFVMKSGFRQMFQEIYAENESLKKQLKVKNESRKKHKKA